MNQAAEEALERFRKERGFNRPWHFPLAQEAPEALNAYLDYWNTLYDRSVLDPKVQELIIIGVDAHQNWPGIKVHIKRALELGATKAELVQTLIISGLAGGVHTMAFGLVALDEVLKESGNAGV